MYTYARCQTENFKYSPKCWHSYIFYHFGSLVNLQFDPFTRAQIYILNPAVAKSNTEVPAGYVNGICSSSVQEERKYTTEGLQRLNGS